MTLTFPLRAAASQHRQSTTLHINKAVCECFKKGALGCGSLDQAWQTEITAFSKPVPTHKLCFCWQLVLLLPCNSFVSLVNEKHYILKLIKVRTHNFSL